MREILFRGKRSDNGNWIEGHLFARINDCFIVPLPVITSKSLVDGETVGQFTGLKDRNGKKVFEGDVVHCVSMTDMANMVVIFEDGEFRMVLCEKYKDYIPGCGFYAIRCFDKEVIGNIHDNPELLEQ